VIDGTTVLAGELVDVSVLAANRDPARFPDPDVIDITRKTNGHLTFGYGVRPCLGAPLARLEAEIALRGLLGRLPRLRLAVPAEQLRRRPGVLVHGLEELPIALT
jgi:cytochrome P450